ncbi:MAG: YtxH domain-containing protein [Gemmatimonadota bacterium]
MARTTEFSGSRPSGTGSGSRKSDLDASESLDSTSSARPRGKSYSEDMQWRHAAIFGAGVAIGALIGASAALLYAPQSGEETREMLSDRAQKFGGRIGDRLDDARGDLGWYMRRGRRKLRRGAERGRWTGQDIADKMRRGW